MPLYPYKTVLILGGSRGTTDLIPYGISFKLTSCRKYSGDIPLIILYISHIMLRSLFTYNRASADLQQQQAQEEEGEEGRGRRPETLS